MTFAQFRRIGLTSFALFASLLTMALSHAVAGPLATTNFALNDGFGPAGGRWRGSVVVSGAAFGDKVTAQVDWAAFAPGKFQQYLDDQGIAQVDPSGGAEVIYAYQIESVSEAIPGIDTLTLGIDAADARGLVSAPSFVPTGAANEKSPASGGDNTTSMAWFFNGSELQVGDTSSLLVYSSLFAPEFDFLQVNSGVAGPVVSALVASISDRIFTNEIPEPATLALAALALCGVFLRRVR